MLQFAGTSTRLASNSASMLIWNASLLKRMIQLNKKSDMLLVLFTMHLFRSSIKSGKEQAMESSDHSLERLLDSL